MAQRRNYKPALQMSKAAAWLNLVALIYASIWILLFFVNGNKNVWWSNGTDGLLATIGALLIVVAFICNCISLSEIGRLRYVSSSDILDKQ